MCGKITSCHGRLHSDPLPYDVDDDDEVDPIDDANEDDVVTAAGIMLNEISSLPATFPASSWEFSSRLLIACDASDPADLADEQEIVSSFFSLSSV